MILVDYNNVVMTNIFAMTREVQAATDVDDIKNIIRHIFVTTVLSYKQKFSEKYGRIVICADSKKNWRKSIYPEYKANRKKNREDSGLNWTLIFQCMSDLKQEIKDVYVWPLIEEDYLEGDDVIAILSRMKQAGTESSDFFGVASSEKTLIISSDGDMKQLHSETVDQWSPLTKDFVRCGADWSLTEKIAKGDQGDGVPNIFCGDTWLIEKVEGQRAKPISKKIVAELDQYLKNGSTAGSFSEQVIQNINRNRVMIDLTCIPDKYTSTIENMLNNYEVVGSKEKMMNLFISVGASNLFSRIQEV